MITFAVFLQFGKLRGIFAFDFCHSLFVFGKTGIRHHQLFVFPREFCLKSFAQTASFPLVCHNFVFRGSINTP